MTIDQIRERYLSLFEIDPVAESDLLEISSTLGVHFPADFVEISRFYAGGILGGISHHAISPTGPATNITEETRRLRAAVSLPHSMVVLAEPPESLIVMQTRINSDAAVIRCDATDVYRLGNIKDLHNPELWESYADFFSFLVEREAEDRASL